MTLVAEGEIGEREYEFPGDFVPPFLTSMPEKMAAATASPLALVPPDEAVVAASLLEPSPAPDPSQVEVETTLAAAPYSKKRRTLMGIIRAAWFYIFTGLGAVVDYLILKYTDLPLPTGAATAFGGILYAAKRAFWPDTTL
jgi:hypothetical protein